MSARELTYQKFRHFFQVNYYFFILQILQIGKKRNIALIRLRGQSFDLYCEHDILSIILNLSAPMLSLALIVPRAASAALPVAGRAISSIRLLHVGIWLLGPADKRRGGGGSSADAPVSAPASDGALGGMTPAELAAAAGRAVEHARRELSRLRGGVASPSMLDAISVDAYGERQPMSALAQISLKNPMLFVVSPFDAALAPAIANAVRDAGLGLNPIVDGAAVRVPVPKPSRETRDANIKLVAKISEAAKATIRRHRQASLDGLKKAEGVSSDDVFRQMKELQDVASKVTEEVTKLAEKKRAEIEAA